MNVSLCLEKGLGTITALHINPLLPPTLLAFFLHFMRSPFGIHSTLKHLISLTPLQALSSFLLHHRLISYAILTRCPPCIEMSPFLYNIYDTSNQVTVVSMYNQSYHKNILLGKAKPGFPISHARESVLQLSFQLTVPKVSTH